MKHISTYIIFLQNSKGKMGIISFSAEDAVASWWRDHYQASSTKILKMKSWNRLDYCPGLTAEIVPDGLVGVLLQDVYDPENITTSKDPLPVGWDPPHKLKLAPAPPHSSLCSGWHAHPESEAGPPKRMKALNFSLTIDKNPLKVMKYKDIYSCSVVHCGDHFSELILEMFSP